MDYKNIIDKLTPIVEDNPSNPSFARLADAHLQSGQMRKAISILTEGVKANPAYITGQIILAKCLYKAGYLPQAKERFKIVLRLDPENLSALWSIAKIEFEEGNNEKGFETLRKILGFDPFNETVKGEIARKSREIYGEPEPSPEVVLEPIPEQIPSEIEEKPLSELEQLLAIDVSRSSIEILKDKEIFTEEPITDTGQKIEPQAIPPETSSLDIVLEAPIFKENEEVREIAEKEDHSKFEEVPVEEKGAKQSEPLGIKRVDEEEIHEFSVPEERAIKEPEEPIIKPETRATEIIAEEEEFTFAPPSKRQILEESKPLEDILTPEEAPISADEDELMKTIEKRTEFEPFEETLEIDGLIKKTEFVSPMETRKSTDLPSFSLADELDIEQFVKDITESKRPEEAKPGKSHFPESSGQEVHTMTMAEIYAGQGQTKKAIEIYEVILAETEDAEKRSKIEQRIKHLREFLTKEQE